MIPDISSCHCRIFSAFLLIQAKIFAYDSASIPKCRPRDVGSFAHFANADWTARRENLKARINDPIEISIPSSARAHITI
jgi:hypothetical protein